MARRLRRSGDGRPGWRRLRAGRGFRYVDGRGRSIRAPQALARIRALAIPPAYGEVWICPDPCGHIQATARDARGRKQYRYHPDWQRGRDARKFARIAALGRALPRIRARLRRDLARPRLPRDKVLAAIVALLDLTGLRIGNREYARVNGSYGLTTLRRQHLATTSQPARLRFRGKGGVEHEVRIEDPQLARILARCRDLPGDSLFQYLDDDGRAHSVRAAEVNDYLRRVAGQDFSAKDFRTWAASVQTLGILRRQPWRTRAQAHREVVTAVRCVAQRLGNTAAVCRKSYIDPLVIESYLASRLPDPSGRSPRGLRADERRYLELRTGELRTG